MKQAGYFRRALARPLADRHWLCRHSERRADLKAGGQDFLNKPVQSDELLRALQKALADQQASRDQQIALDSIRARLATLSPRERQVFELVIRGKPSKQIAHTLGTAERTIKAYRHNMMEKMQVQGLAELVSLAERVGVLNGPADNQPTI